MLVSAIQQCKSVIIIHTHTHKHICIYICKKAKWLSGEALQIAEKRREAKGKGEKERFECRVPRIARREKKAFLSNQCKEIQENNRMGTTREISPQKN